MKNKITVEINNYKIYCFEVIKIEVLVNSYNPPRRQFKGSIDFDVHQVTATVNDINGVSHEVTLLPEQIMSDFQTWMQNDLEDEVMVEWQKHLEVGNETERT